MTKFYQAKLVYSARGNTLSGILKIAKQGNHGKEMHVDMEYYKPFTEKDSALIEEIKDILKKQGTKLVLENLSS
uniref:Uncharacterized protein n=1 Tax=candidate division CPR3 bacterium TaxID=2268181 RepID=A0A7C4RA51_UNCC3